MEKAIVPALIASAVLILIIILFSGWKARKLDFANLPGLHRPKEFIRLVEIVLLLAFCAAALLAINRVVSAALGLGLMGLFLLCWIPFRFWQNARLRLDDTKITYISPLGRIEQMDWQEIRTVDTAQSGVTLQGGGKEMRIPAWFSGLERIKETIRQRTPGQDK